MQNIQQNPLIFKRKPSLLNEEKLIKPIEQRFVNTPCKPSYSSDQNNLIHHKSDFLFQDKTPFKPPSLPGLNN